MNRDGEISIYNITSTLGTAKLNNVIFDKGTYEFERDVYEYCFEVLLSTFLNLLAIIILAVATGLYLETLCFTISFMTLRGTAGGYHAKTHWGCFLILMLVYAIFAITLFFIPNA